MPNHPNDYLTPYQDMVRRVGPRFEALLWNSPETQQVRFEAIVEMIALTGRIVVDAGCGRGDLAKFLHERKIPYGRYVGIDGVPELLEVARASNLPGAVFVEGDFVQDPGVFDRPVVHAAEAGLPPERAATAEAARGHAEVIVFSGSLNTLPQPRAQLVLESAWTACTEALVFNFLSDRTGRAHKQDSGPARRFDTLAMLRWAMDRTPLVRFRQDYLKGNDATIVMWRE